MPTRDDGAGPEEPRVATGIPELDEMLLGGLPPHRPYLIVGPSGTGKTKLALRFLVEGVRRGENCLVVTLEEPPNEMKINHRALHEELDRVFVFDAIPDVMRYERAPFKDIAAVRASVRFAEVPAEIRKTAELTSVEVTFIALEQTLKMEMARRPYHRLVVDSLTALQYFCMKGFDETVGAQSFLRFLADLRITTLLTVESPLEDVETAERQLARGEIRLFRWDLDGRTVRAIGVEKIRGSPHDIRLHPYRITPAGIEINLGATISRDTRQIIEGSPVATEAPSAPAAAPATVAPAPPAAPPAFDVVAFDEELAALVATQSDIQPVRAALDAAASARARSRPDAAAKQLERAAAATREILTKFAAHPPEFPATVPVSARDRLLSLARARAGAPVGPVRAADVDIAWRHVEPFLSRGVPSPVARPSVEPPAPPSELPPAAARPSAPAARSPPRPAPREAPPAVPHGEEPMPPPSEPVAARPAGTISRTATRIAGAFARAGGAIAHPSHPAEGGSAPTAGAPSSEPLAPTPSPTGVPPLPSAMTGLPAAPPEVPPAPPPIAAPPAVAAPTPAPAPPVADRPPLPDPAVPSVVPVARPPPAEPITVPRPPAPEAVPPPPPAPIAAPPAKPRRRASTTPRKRKAPPVDSASIPASPLPSGSTSEDASKVREGPAPPPGVDAVAGLPKVNRRKPRKRKASPVDAALPVEVPPVAPPPAPEPPPSSNPSGDAGAPRGGSTPASVDPVLPGT
ncbi:MAG: hypothetical protein L3K15_09000 [Thermoplasmata archaeon]|nr:hypothetical protein [Thermoplasmata archaeon]